MLRLKMTRDEQELKIKIIKDKINYIIKTYCNEVDLITGWDIIDNPGHSSTYSNIIIMAPNLHDVKDSYCYYAEIDNINFPGDGAMICIANIPEIYLDSLCDTFFDDCDYNPEIDIDYTINMDYEYVKRLYVIDVNKNEILVKTGYDQDYKVI
jgi:hypothetical protein